MTKKLNQKQQLNKYAVMPRFFCKECNSKHHCSTKNFGLKCEIEKQFEIKNYGKIIK